MTAQGRTRGAHGVINHRNLRPSTNQGGRPGILPDRWGGPVLGDLVLRRTIPRLLLTQDLEPIGVVGGHDIRLCIAVDVADSKTFCVVFAVPGRVQALRSEGACVLIRGYGFPRKAGGGGAVTVRLLTQL